MLGKKEGEDTSWEFLVSEDDEEASEEEEVSRGDIGRRCMVRKVNVRRILCGDRRGFAKEKDLKFSAGLAEKGVGIEKEKGLEKGNFRPLPLHRKKLSRLRRI